MSISWSSVVVCGFELEIVERKKEVTKFNENTGEPRKELAFDRYDAVVDGKTVLKDVDDPWYFCDYPAKVAGDKFAGLSAYRAYDDEDYVLGAVLAETAADSSSRQNRGVDDFKPEVPDAVKKFAKEFDVDYQWWLLLMTS